MADDTRLAEACLLLNYSTQSYREQLLLAEKLGQCTVQHGGTIDTRCHHEVSEKKSSSPKLITSPSEQEYVLDSHENHNLILNDCCASPSGSEINLTNDDCSESSSREDLVIEPSDSMLATYYNTAYNSSKEPPINNLLAAVNCALPGSRSRPNILQRSSNNTTPSKPTALSNSIPDHDYCQQDTPHSTDQIGSVEERDEVASELPGRSNVSKNDRSIDSQKHHPGSKRKQKHFDSPFNPTTKRPLKLVAVHLGAGSSHNDAESLQLARSICEEVMLQSTTPHLITSCKKKRKTSCFSGPQDNSSQRSECRDCHNKINVDNHSEMAVVQLIKLMEDNQSLNCGYGSNLNMKGQVECDASLMSDKTQMWAGVGAVSGCKNPILLAKSLYDHLTIPRPLGLVQPNLLVGSGAKQWMREHCPRLSVMDSKLVSSKSFSTYQKLKSRYDTAVRLFNRESNTLTDTSLASLPIKDEVTFSSPSKQQSNNNQSPKLKRSETTDSKYVEAFSTSPTNLDHGFYCISTRDNLKKVPSFARAAHRVKEPMNAPSDCIESTVESSDVQHLQNPDVDIEFQFDTDFNSRLDTVGAIAVDSENNFTSAISSGGLLLKYKGRVGQAAIPGAGCWAEDSVAVTTTGVGEYLTLNMFARKFYEKVLTLRLLYDLGHVEKKPDLSSLISCGVDECFEDLKRSPALAHVPPVERLAGMLAVSTLNSKESPDRIDDKDLYLSYAHNTDSMCVGYMTCNDIVGHSVMSRRLDEKETTGETVVKTIRFSLDPNNYFDSYYVETGLNQH